MTLPEFATALVHELQARQTPCDLIEMPDFAAGVWPAAQQDPEPVRWADEFLQMAWTADR